jgi:hypothetical protein
MNGGNRQPEYEAPAWITWPIRIVAVIVVVPLRLAYEALSAVGRFLGHWVFRPIGWLLEHAVGRPLAWLWRTVLEPAIVFLLRYLVWIPLTFVLRYLLWIPVSWFVVNVLWRPLVWFARTVLRPPLAWLWARRRAIGHFLYRFLLWPIGRLLYYGLVVPLTFLGKLIAYGWRGAGYVLRLLYRYGLRPLGLAVAWTWRHTAVPVGRAIAWAWAHSAVPLGRGIAWIWRHTAVPAARWIDESVLQPARRTARAVLEALGIRQPARRENVRHRRAERATRPIGRTTNASVQGRTRTSSSDRSVGLVAMSTSPIDTTKAENASPATPAQRVTSDRIPIHRTP